jgi:DNA-binding MarR family transcriptional regulator
MADAVESLVWEVRRCVRELAVAADKALEPLGLTASDRALIEFLARESGPISLAALARKRSVSRQHVHQSLARLRDPRWVEKAADPKDTRTVLLRLTGEGRSLWKEIRRVDRTLLRRMARQVDAAKVRAATKTLHAIRNAIRGNDHD